MTKTQKSEQRDYKRIVGRERYKVNKCGSIAQNVAVTVRAIHNAKCETDILNPLVY